MKKHRLNSGRRTSQVMTTKTFGPASAGSPPVFDFTLEVHYEPATVDDPKGKTNDVSNTDDNLW